MTSLSTNTNFALVDTRYSSATINLPPLTTSYGRSITVKDGYGNAFASTITVLTDPADYFEDLTQSKTIAVPFAFQTWVAGSNLWHNISEAYPSTLIVDSFISVSTLQSDNSLSIQAPSFTVSGNLIASSIQTLSLTSLTSIETTTLEASTITISSLNALTVSTGALIAPTIAPPQEFTFGTLSPSTIDTLAYWFDMASLPPNQTISSIPSQSPLNFQSTLTTIDPQFQSYTASSTLNGYQSLYFSSSFYYLEFDTPYTGKEITFMGVFQLNDPTIMPQWLITGLSFHSFLGPFTILGPLTIDTATSSEAHPLLVWNNTPFQTATIGISSPTIFSATWSLDGSVTQHINGFQTAQSSFSIYKTYPNDPVLNIDDIFVGSVPPLFGPDLIDPFNGYLGELLIFNAGLPTSDRQRMEGYLAQRWGLRRYLPPSHPYR